MFLIISVLLLVIFLFIWLLDSSMNEKRKLLKNFPGPRPLFFIGNILTYKSTSQLLSLIGGFLKTYGPVVKVETPLMIGLIVSEYKLLEAILSSTKTIKKSIMYEYIHPWLGTGLLTSDGLKWKQHRRALTPTFHFQILDQFIDIFNQGSQKLVEKLNNVVGEKSVDIFPFITLCTLDIITETAMGTKLNAQENENVEYVQSVQVMLKIVIERIFNLLQIFDFTYPMTKNYYKQKKALKILHNHTNSVIHKRRKELEQESKEGFNTKKRKVFLDFLLEAEIDGRSLTHEEIREEVDTFMFEGHDTTAAAIAFALYSLANSPEAQEEALKEQKLLFGENKNPILTYNDLQSMRYLEMVIKETLRLYPSVPIIGREITEPLHYNGDIIPPGTQIIIFPFWLHRSPEFFQDPEKFNPKRFEENDHLPYSFIPFSAGPRNCIGQKFAMQEMKSVISSVIRNFELVPASPQHSLHLALDTILRSINGTNICLKPRN